MPQGAIKASSFFDLPRELRDLIYRYVWCLNPELKKPSTRFSSVPSATMYLRYQSHHVFDIEVTDESGDADTSGKFPPGLAASKQLLNEALDQFFSRAE